MEPEISLNCLKVERDSVVSRSLRLNATGTAISNYIKLDSSLRVSLKKKNGVDYNETFSLV